jgi:hypothetical protein
LEKKEVVEGEDLAEFVQKARVPHFVECLGYVQKGGGTALPIIKGCLDVAERCVVAAE